MNRVLYITNLRTRVGLPAVGIFMVLLIWLTKATSTPGFQELDGLGIALVIFYLLGPVFAALLGAELGGAGPGGWAFTLARPVTRRRVLIMRALADATVMAALAAITLAGAGGLEAKYWLPALVLWLTLHGTGAWAGSLGLSALPAAAVGVGVAGVAAAAGLASSWVALGFLDMQSVMLGMAAYLGANLQPEAGALAQWWLIAIPPATSCLMVMVWGWGSAARGIKRSPQPLRWRPAVLALAGWMAFTILAIAGTTSGLKHMLPEVGPHYQFGEVMFGNGRVVEQTFGTMGLPELRLLESNGQLLYSTPVSDLCWFSETRDSTVLLLCGKKQLLFRSDRIEPDQLVMSRDYRQFPGGGGGKLAPASDITLSPDATRVVYYNHAAHELQIRPVTSNVPGIKISDQPFGQPVLWDQDDVLHSLAQNDGTWRINRLRTDGTVLAPVIVAEDPKGILKASALALLPGDILVIAVREKRVRNSSYRLVYPDGRIRELPPIEGKRLQLKGVWPDGSLIMVAHEETGPREVWRVPIEGSPEKLGFINLPGHDSFVSLWIWKAPDGPGMLTVGYDKVKSEPAFWRLNRGELQDPVPSRYPVQFRSLLRWSYREQAHEAHPKGLLVQAPRNFDDPDWAPNPMRVPWPTEPPFAPVEAPPPFHLPRLRQPQVPN